MRGISKVIGRSRVTIAVMGALLLIALAHWGAPTDTAAANVAVTIDNLAFTPATITVPVGTQVVWTNKQAGIPHTTTSDTGAWDSGIMNTGATFSFTFKEAGTFAYHCNVHPTMHGTVVVTAGAAPAATTAVGSAAAGTTTTGTTAAATTAPTIAPTTAPTATTAATAAATTAPPATRAATSAATTPPVATGTGGGTVATQAPTTLPATGAARTGDASDFRLLAVLLLTMGVIATGIVLRRRAAQT